MSVSAWHVTWGSEMNIPASLMLITLLCTTLPLHAAEAEVTAADESPADNTDNAATVAADDSTATAEDATPGTMAADDTFVPTVEISEDLSVSFPADI